MGIERASVSTKLAREDEEFIFEWSKNLKPHEVSQSSLTGLCVRIVRILVRRGELNIQPEALQDFLENVRDVKDAADVRDVEPARPTLAQVKKIFKK